MLDQSDLRLVKIVHNFYELRNSIKEGGGGGVRGRGRWLSMQWGAFLSNTCQSEVRSFSLLICLDTAIFVMLNYLAVKETTSPKMKATIHWRILQTGNLPLTLALITLNTALFYCSPKQAIKWSIGESN